MGRGGFLSPSGPDQMLFLSLGVELNHDSQSALFENIPTHTLPPAKKKIPRICINHFYVGDLLKIVDLFVWVSLNPAKFFCGVRSNHNKETNQVCLLIIKLHR